MQTIQTKDINKKSTEIHLQIISLHKFNISYNLLGYSKKEVFLFVV